MAISKRGKIWLIILAIPVTLILAGIVAAKIYFTDARLKALVVPKLQDAMNRHVEVNNISLSVFPSLAVSIDGLSISNPEGMKFDRDQFITLENLRINVHLFPLLHSRVEIGEIVLNHPVIYCEVTHDGKKNFSSKKSGAQASEGTSSGTMSSGGLLVSNLEINNGEIEFVNKKFDSHILIDGFHQTASAEAASGENTIVINGASTIDQLSYGTVSSWYLKEQPLSLSEKISYNLSTDVLTFDDVKGKLKDLPLSIGGTISKLKEDTNMMDLTVTSPGVQMEHVLSLLPATMLKKTEGLSSSGDIKFSVAIKGPSGETVDPATNASFSMTNGTIHYGSLPKSITNINLTGMFDKPSAPIDAKGIGKFVVDKFSASLGGNDVGGHLSVNNFDDPVVSAVLNGALNLSEVKDFYPLEKGSDVSGMMKANFAIDGKAKSPQSMKASGAIALQNVSVKTPSTTKPLKNLNGIITFNNQAIESKQLAMNVGESDMNLSFSLKNYLGMVMESAAKTAGKPSATVTLNSKQLRMEDLMSDEPAAGEQSSKKTTEKKGGLLPGIDLDANVNIGKLVTKKFTFDNAHGTVAVSNGIVNLKSMAVNAFQGTIQSKGTLDLRDQNKSPFNLQLDIKNVESNSLLSNFTSFGQYLSGKFSTSTTMAGDLNDTLGLKTESLLGNGTVQMAEGKLLGLPLMQKISDFTNLADLRQVNFKDWTNAFSISNGRLTLKDLNVRTGTTDFVVGGSQGLDGTMDYNLIVKLPASMSDRLNIGGVGGEILQFFKDKDGRINLPLNVSGTQSQPVVKLDTQAQQKAMKSGLQENLKKKAEEGLKNLFKRP